MLDSGAPIAMRHCLTLLLLLLLPATHCCFCFCLCSSCFGWLCYCCCAAPHSGLQMAYRSYKLIASAAANLKAGRPQHRNPFPGLLEQPWDRSWQIRIIREKVSYRRWQVNVLLHRLRLPPKAYVHALICTARKTLPKGEEIPVSPLR